MIEKIIVLGGKGGVGKSSISAATAVLLSDLLPEKRILLISFDMAHNLSDFLSKDIGNAITPITGNLWAIEPDANVYAEIYTKDLVNKMKTLMKQMPLVGRIPQIEEFIDTTFTSDSIPLALKNAMFFQKILDAEDINSQEAQFDIIIADFPPTANMITLFEIPEDQVKVVLKYSLNFFNSIKDAMQNFTKMFRQFLKPFNDDYEKRKELGKEIFNMMVDLEKRGERMRDMTNKYINLDAIHINMIIPKKHAKKCDFCGQISTIQQRYLVEIKNEFKSEKIWESNRLKEEPIGLDGLRKLAREIYNDASASDILNPKA